ncbi:DUF4238 domain-containing protein [Phocaeicola barnesiae]|nr:DUF4238 domain-containing protein [Phocaeicola barnesiae]
MSAPIKHHYVPQCYLKKFSLDKINVNYYDKELCKCDKSKINEICQLENFYKLSQSAPYYIETDFFANNYEDKLGRILTHFETIDIDLDKIPYDKKHRINLSRQIVLQYMRTPFYRNTKSENELNAYYELLKQILKEYNFEVEEIEFKANNKAEFHKTLLLENEIIDDIIKDIADANWELLYTSSSEFYTSDNPVAVVARNDVAYCEAIKYFAEIYYPLNSKLTLHIKAQRPASTKKINIRVCGSDELLTVNNLIINNAVKYVIYTNNFN